MSEELVQPQPEPEQLLLEESVVEEEDPEDVIMTDVVDDDEEVSLEGNQEPMVIDDDEIEEEVIATEDVNEENSKEDNTEEPELVEEANEFVTEDEEPAVKEEEDPSVVKEPIPEDEEEPEASAADISDKVDSTEEDDLVPPLVEESVTPPGEAVSDPVPTTSSGWEEPVKLDEEMVAMGVPSKDSHALEEIEESSTMASGWTQVKALCGKNFLTKMRTPGATIAEVFSPVLLMLVLWYGFTLTDKTITPKAFYHYMNIDLPFFWESRDYSQTDVDGFNPTNIHRRRLMTMDENGEEFQPVDFDLEETEEEAKRWDWSRLLGEGTDYKMEEDMGLINDLLMIGHARKLTGQKLDDEDTLTGYSFKDDGIEMEVQDEVDSGDWYEEVWADIKAETVDKIDWEDVEAEIQDNFGDLWDNAKEYFFSARYYPSFQRMDLMRKRLADFLRRPIVVPTFGQYVWASKLLRSFLNVRRIPRVFRDSRYGREWGNLLTLGTIHLSPSDHRMTQSFIEYLENNFPGAASQVSIRTHANQEEAMKHVMGNLDDERTWAVIDLANLADGSGDEKGGSFTIRLNYTTVPNTALIENYVALGLSTTFQRYYLSGYLTLQRTINDFVMEQDGCNPHLDPFYSMPMPTAEYEQNVFFVHVGYLLGLVLVMAFLYPTSRLIQGLVEERETRMKETLLILGVRPWAHTCSWVLTTAASFLFITMLMSIVLKYVFLHQTFMMIWFWMGLFSMASMSFCFFLASFFSKAKLAAVIGPMALFASLLPRFIFFGTNRYEAVGAKYVASILPGVALAFGADIVGDYEYGEQPVSDNVWAGSYSFGSSLCFLVFDAVFYMGLAWYTEQVIPREFGAAPKPWYFPFVWCFPKRFTSDKTLADSVSVSDDELSLTGLNKTTGGNSECIEAVNDPALTPRVFIHDLVKRYNKKQTKPSINHLNLTLYESQITALLGHNGAGKTTTVSVLTGLYPPTSGDVTIYGNSIVEDLAKARQSMGICPQHNVLFDRLTVMEHLEFFSKIKGVSFAPEDLTEKAFELGLTDDQLRTTAGALSGGNKRKLSVAIAFVGNPRFVILDEPTSAMDPTARRRTWEVLRKKRAGRSILLTTHFMDEAEHLSDRVAVMKEGDLQCCGSPLYLKGKYNLGWNLTVVMQKPKEAEGAEDEYAGTQQRIASFLQQYVPGAALVRRSGRELTICFPKGSEDLFPECFDAFEQQAKDLGVSSYGVENASFEEVFLLLAEKNSGIQNEDKQDEISLAETGSVRSVSRVSISDSESVASSKLSAESGETDGTDESLTMAVKAKVDTLKLKDWEQYKSMSAVRQIGLLYWKRWAIQKRDAKGAFFTLIVPVMLIALVILVLTFNIVVAGPPIEMSPDLYGDAYSVSKTYSNQILFAGGNSASDSSSVESEFLFMDSGLSHDYPRTEFQHVDKSTTELSRYLLDTYNDHDHPTRFGAFAVDDSVEVSVNFNFTAFRDQIEYYTSKDKFYGSKKLQNQKIDLLEIMGFTGENGRLFWKKTVSDMEEDFYSLFKIDPQARIRTTDMHSLTRKALRAITESSDQELEEVRSQYEQGIRNVTEFVYQNAMAFLQSREAARGLKTNVTKIYDDFMVEAKKVVENSDKIESTLRTMVGKLVGQGFFQSEQDKEPNSVVYRWQGDMDALLREFLNDLYALGEDPTTDTLSVYALGQKLYNEMMNLVNINLEKISGSKYTVDDIKQVLFEAFGAGNDNFSREVIMQEMSGVINGVAALYGYGDSVTSVEALADALDWVEYKLRDYSDESIKRIPGKIFVAPLIVLDYVLGQWDVETISPDEAFGYLSEILGGNRRNKDGYIFFRAKDIILDLGKLEFDFNKIFLATGDGVQMELDRQFSFRFAVDELEKLVPNNSTLLQFRFNVPSKTNLLHNSSSPHAVAAFNQAYMEHRYKQCLGDVQGKTRLTSVNHPLPLTEKQSLEMKIMLSVLAGLFILIPFCYIPATFIVSLVKERISKSKHLQLVSGVNMSAYWVSTYLWDLSLYFLLTCCIMLIFVAYGPAAEVFIGSKESLLCTFLMVFGYGFSSLPFAYLLSRKFNNSSTAQIAVAGIGWLTGFVTVIAYIILINTEKTEDLARAAQPYFRLFPAYNIGEGFMFMSYAFWYREILGYSHQPLDWDVTGRSISYLFGLSVPYFLLVLVLEYANDGGAGGLVGRALRALSYLWTKMMLKWHGIELSADEQITADYTCMEGGQLCTDEDVVRERQHVSENMDELRRTAPVVLSNLWKVYPPSIGVVGIVMLKIRQLATALLCFWFKDHAIDAPEDGEEKTFEPKQAVRGVHTAINKGETFALLGANGAGKTTIMGMLTGDITSTNGTGFIAGHDATGGSNNGVTQARRNIGFCPQQDPLLDLMTGRETLTMFARLRGVPLQEVDALVEELLERLTLTPHADKITKAYSGGNKRKLSLGVALIGDPKVLLIDESSSGLDPLAKRKMWDLIEEAARHRSVVLTTHSMQEAEALCTRVAIMVKGQYACLGSVQHLKTKYLDGYSVDMYCNSSASQSDVDAVVCEVLQAIPGSSLSERHGRFMRFQISNVSTLGLGTCFRRLQELKNDPSLSVENYSVSQCSLEHVFVKLVNGDDMGSHNACSLGGAGSGSLAGLDPVILSTQSNGDLENGAATF